MWQEKDKVNIQSLIKSKAISLNLLWPRESGLYQTAKSRLKNVHYLLGCGDSIMGVCMSKLIAFYTLNMCHVFVYQLILNKAI